MKLTINDNDYEAQPGETIIQVADRVGVYIPRFCYHKKLSVPANCRMCLVDVEKAPKALPACATPVADGMKVMTKSVKAVEAQKTVMEFLLINHPLDCPICDQGGQCELQDLAMGFGADTSGFVELKRAVPNPDLGPLIATEMTRCIHCTRCVRFEEEIAGQRELGGMFRGEHMKITTYVRHTVKSELSGNAIDVCPVGALTSKPFRFKARAWEMLQTPTIAAHDCLGSNIHAATLNGQLLRVTPKENEAINEVWISDRDRFAYTGIHSRQRLMQPMLKMNGDWQAVSWEQAFDHTLQALQTIFNTHGVNQLGALISPSATVEEMYLMQQWVRGIGSANIDHRLRISDTRDQAKMPVMPTLGVNIADISQQEVILLIGSNIRKEQPIAGMKVRQAQRRGAKIYAVNMQDYVFNFDVANKLIVKPSVMPQALAQIAKALLQWCNKTNDVLAQLVHDIAPHEQAEAIARGLLSAKKISIFLGIPAHDHPEASVIRQWVSVIAELSGANVGYLPQGANSSGAWLTGCVPHRLPGGQPTHEVGLSAEAMLKQGLKAFLLVNVEPELDCADSGQALAALRQAECVVAVTPFATEAVKAYATVMLPAASFGETSGTFINIQADWQSFRGVVPPPGEARPIWKILRVLGNVFQLPGFDYAHSEAVLTAARLHAEKVHPAQGTFDLPKGVRLTDNAIERVGDMPTYSTDLLVRQAEPLQRLQADEHWEAAHMNSATAEQLNVKANEMIQIKTQAGVKSFLVIIDMTVADSTIRLASGVSAISGLGGLYSALEIVR